MPFTLLRVCFAYSGCEEGKECKNEYFCMDSFTSITMYNRERESEIGARGHCRLVSRCREGGKT